MIASNESSPRKLQHLSDDPFEKKVIHESVNTEESAEIMPTCEDLRENDKRSRKNVQSLKVKCYLSEMKVNRIP